MLVASFWLFLQPLFSVSAYFQAKLQLQKAPFLLQSCSDSTRAPREVSPIPALPGIRMQAVAHPPFQTEVEKYSLYFCNKAQTGKWLHRGRAGIWCQIPELLIEVNSTRHIEDGFYLSQQESSTAELTQNNSSPLLLSLLLYSAPNDFSPPYPITTTTPDQHILDQLPYATPATRGTKTIKNCLQV